MTDYKHRHSSPFAWPLARWVLVQFICMKLYNSNRQSGGSAAFLQILDFAKFTSVLHVFWQGWNLCILSDCNFLPFQNKHPKFPVQSSVRYIGLVVRTDFLIARSDLGALRPIFTAATVRVDWRTRGLFVSEGPRGWFGTYVLVYYMAHSVLLFYTLGA